MLKTVNMAFIWSKYIVLYIHPVHMILLNRFGTDSNRFGRHVNASKKPQIDSKPIWLKPTCE